ncbi:hypothetical protein PR001_g13309 [Phytophthora rubi]|uniref:Uncharacterized protein n=1 Tax=Phytophthora rubi TaxID=129364 RepID=A0A6A3LU11_9STRA|nr:hypothetical protein PR002_g12992 [Phytophthora rubi]KAE9021730.1 hypothetical protein PR001_g13309 [Phytophthora rubi]
MGSRCRTLVHAIQRRVLVLASGFAKTTHGCSASQQAQRQSRRSKPSTDIDGAITRVSHV